MIIHSAYEITIALDQLHKYKYLSVTNNIKAFKFEQNCFEGLQM